MNAAASIDDVLAGLNLQQREAATFGNGPLLSWPAPAPARRLRRCTAWHG